MKNKLVSIIVPVYNAEKFIIETIESIKKQTYKNWELILVDDISTDKSIKIIKKYIKENKELNITLIELKEKGYTAVARNTGIEYSKGNYITFLDADDLWEKNKLKKQVSFMNKNNYEFTFHNYEFANEEGLGNGKIVEVPTKITYKQSLKNTTIWTSTVMLNIDKLSKETIKMPNVRRGQDTACWWKILKTIEAAYGLNENLAFYRRTNESLSANKLTALKRTWHLYRKVEKLNILTSTYNFCWYVFNAVKRRV